MTWLFISKTFLPLIGIHLLAVASPGPDFTLVTRNSLLFSRASGLMAALGVGAGILVHVLYSVAGISIIIQKSPGLYKMIQMAGAIYIIYLGLQGIKSLFLKSDHTTEGNGEKLSSNYENQSLKKSFFQGFITNTLNPKATFYFVGIFSQFFNENSTFIQKIVTGLSTAIVTSVWFSILACIFTHPKLTSLLKSKLIYVERVLGIILMALGVNMLLL